MGNNNENINNINAEVNEDVELVETENVTTDAETKDTNGAAMLIGAAIAGGVILAVGGIVFGVKKIIGVFSRKKAENAETADEEVQPDSEEK